MASMKVVEDYVILNNPNPDNDFIRMKIIKEDSPAFDILFEIQGIQMEVDEENDSASLNIDFKRIDESTGEELPDQDWDQQILDDVGEAMISIIEEAIATKKFIIENEEEENVVIDSSEQNRVLSSDRAPESGPE